MGLQAILTQVGHLVIVNNGCQADILSKLERLAAEQPGSITLITSPQNNLALAQNLGIQYARDNGYKYILLLDQDSRPAEKMVEQLLDAYHADETPTSIGIVAPHMVDTNTNREHYYIAPWLHVAFRRLEAKPNRVLEPVLWVIASGSLIPVQCFSAVGVMDESYGIDYVDKEFCLRLVSRGFRILVVSDALLHHQIGRCSDHEVLGLTVTATNHPPARRYTIYRNRLRTCGRYGLCIPAFLLYECGGIIYDLARIVLFEQDKAAKLKAVGSGIYAALTGE